MKRTTGTIAAAALLATCMTSCGGGSKDYATDICNRLQSCNALSVMGVTTLSACITTGNQEMSQLSGSARDSANQAMDQCLATSDCTSFTGCISYLQTNGPSAVNTPTPTADPIAAACNRLQTCGDLSLLDASTVSQCTTIGNQSLSQVPSSEITSVVQMLNQCLTLSDCASFASCVNTLIANGTSSVTPAPTAPVPSDTYVTSVCSKAQACGALSTTFSQCVAVGNEAVGALTSGDLATFYQELSQCLAQSDCATFVSCVSTLGV